jgi:hypothetical protein
MIIINIKIIFILKNYLNNIYYNIILIRITNEKSNGKFREEIDNW